MMSPAWLNQSMLPVVLPSRSSSASKSGYDGGYDARGAVLATADRSRLAAWTRDLHTQGRELVLCGDINIARTEMDVHPRERKPGIIGQRPQERELFSALVENLVDVGRQPRDEAIERAAQLRRSANARRAADFLGKRACEF